MTYAQFEEQIESLKNEKNIDFFVAGKSLLNQNIYGAHIGSYNGVQLFINGGIHAREWVSSLLCVQLAKEYATRQFDGGIYFIFAIDVDGIRLCLDGVQSVPCAVQRNFLLDVNGQSTNFSLWKADVQGVDLNTNFDALWGGGAQNLFCPSPENFVGFYPNSQREVLLCANFVEQNKPQATICYHTKGEVIYWGFEVLTQAELQRDKQIVDAVANATGYEPIKTANSTGGLSDFVALTTRQTAFTVELGNASLPHPLTEEQLPQMFEQNKEVPQIVLNLLNQNK